MHVQTSGMNSYLLHGKPPSPWSGSMAFSHKWSSSTMRPALRISASVKPLSAICTSDILFGFPFCKVHVVIAWEASCRCCFGPMVDVETMWPIITPCIYILLQLIASARGLVAVRCIGEIVNWCTPLGRPPYAGRYIYARASKFRISAVPLNKSWNGEVLVRRTDVDLYVYQIAKMYFSLN